MRQAIYLPILSIALAGIGIVSIKATFFNEPITYENDSAIFIATTSEATQKAETKLMFVGDIMLSRAIGKIMGSEGDFSFPFRLVKPFLEKADFLFGNLESPVSARGVKSGSIYSFRADPRVMEGLRYAGFDALSLANNHAWDYGAAALLDTLSSLEEIGIGFAGAGKDYEEAHRPSITRVRESTIALLSYTDLLPASLGTENSRPAVSLFDTDTAVREVIDARTHADIVIVSLHWGNEYETESREIQKQIAHRLIDVGADLIIGHHPHVVQEVEKYKNGYIAYSLGNFVFDQNFSEDTGKGLILIADVKGKSISSIETKEIYFNEQYQPFLAE